jgi:hypothetical protein
MPKLLRSALRCEQISDAKDFPVNKDRAHDSSEHERLAESGHALAPRRDAGRHRELQLWFERLG